MDKKMTLDEAELEDACNLITNLMHSNWKGIQGAISRTDDGRISISINLSMDHSGRVRVLKGKIGYSVKTTDELETQVSDPDQLSMEGI